jgi:hypothetical protein
MRPHWRFAIRGFDVDHQSIGTLMCFRLETGNSGFAGASSYLNLFSFIMWD